MASVLNLISEAFALYRESWKKVVVPFVVLLAIAVIFGLVSFGISLVSQVVCPNTDNLYLLLALCYAPQIFQNLLGMVEQLVGLVVVMAVLAPLWGLVSGKKMGDWKGNLGSQFLNAIKVVIVRFVLTMVALAPLIVFIAINIVAIVAIVQSGSGFGGLAAVGGIAIILVVLLVTVILMMIVSFLLTFFEIEVAVGGKGVFDAIGASYGLVTANLAEAFIFNLAWWLLGIAIAIFTVFLACTICLAPVAMVLSPLVIVPVMWISRLMLWREFGGPGKKR